MIQDQPRLVTACEVCRVSPLGEAAALELAADWAAAHDPELLPTPVLREAWLLARQYLRDREPPGCLLDFLQQTHKLVAAEPDGPVRLTHDHLIDALTAMTSLPRQVLDERQHLDPDQLRAFFNARIMGQPEAIGCLVDRIALIKAGLTDPSRPQGVFLFAGPTGTPILSTGDGTVVFAGRQRGYGLMVEVRHPFGMTTRYAHLSRIRVGEGERVSRGDRIGDMGNTGRSTGTHLHYEVRRNGDPVNPMTFITAGRDVF